VYWGKQEESAILAALGYGGCGGDVPGDARWWVGDAEAACAVAMVPRRRRLPPRGRRAQLWISICDLKEKNQRKVQQFFLLLVFVFLTSLLLINPSIIAFDRI